MTLPSDIASESKRSSMALNHSRASCCRRKKPFRIERCELDVSEWTDVPGCADWREWDFPRELTKQTRLLILCLQPPFIVTVDDFVYHSVGNEPCRPHSDPTSNLCCTSPFLLFWSVIALCRRHRSSSSRGHGVCVWNGGPLLWCSRLVVGRCPGFAFLLRSDVARSMDDTHKRA